MVRRSLLRFLIAPAFSRGGYLCHGLEFSGFVRFVADSCAVSEPVHLIILSVYLPIYVSTYLPTYLPTCLPTYLPPYLPTYLPTCLPACLPTCLPAYLPTYLPTYLPISIYPSIYFYPFICLSCLSVYLSFCLSISISQCLNQSINLSIYQLAKVHNNPIEHPQQRNDCRWSHIIGHQKC